MIVIEDLTVEFGTVRAVDSVHAVFDAPVTGIIGPNGAGKTTLLNAIAGVAPTRGRVVIDGTDVSSVPAYRRSRAGLVRTFQTAQIIDGLTLLDNVLVGCDAMGRAVRHRSRSQVMEVLEFVGLPGGFDRVGASLSGMERRKVEIARALLSSPGHMLLDEPAAGLLADDKAELEDLIGRLHADRGVQVLVIEHDIEVVARVCQRLLVLNFGAVMAEGTPDEVLNDPVVQAAYLGEETAS